jgi:hypothetical protein
MSTTSGWPQDDALDVLRSRTASTVLAYLRAEHGADAVVERPISPSLSMKVPTPANYGDAVQAARMVSGKARQMMIGYAQKARGEGTPWRDLIAPLGTADNDDDEYGYGDDGLNAAFLLVAGRPSMRYDPIYATWTCTTCDKLIRDTGPLAGHPTDAETGHTDDCARHAREIAAYLARSEG